MKNHSILSKKTISYISLLCLIIFLIPLMWLGFYAHAAGDDFTYGCLTRLSFESAGLWGAIKTAFFGTIETYSNWQGTYSAMFLMWLPPNVFGDFFYRLYPSVLILTLCGSIFYLLKPVVTGVLKSDKESWIIISSVVSFLCLEQVPLMGEAFYWYNGSMYYTGFFAATLFFFGGLIRFLLNQKNCHFILLSICALFIAGGNYTSLLPTIIIVFLILTFLIWKKKSKKEIIGVSIPFFFMLAGFLISILAPGNSIRAAEVYGTTPIKAIIKSLLQGYSYLIGWSNVWLFLALVLLTPLFVNIAKGSGLSFKHPFIVLIIAFGIFSSASCPTFYAQNNGGPARAFDLSWYMMVFLVLSSYFYFLGTMLRFWKSWNDASFVKGLNTIGLSCILFVFLALLFIRPISATCVELNSYHAVRALASGDAKYYEAQYQKRLDLLLNPEISEVVLEKYDIPDSLDTVLFLGDMNESPDFFVNQSIASFYGKVAVSVKP